MSALAIKGWCPGALRPMLSGDGLVVRVRPYGGRLDATQAAGLADLAERYGNGLIDVTSRANLQIRGVSEQRPSAAARRACAVAAARPGSGNRIPAQHSGHAVLGHRRRHMFACRRARAGSCAIAPSIFRPSSASPSMTERSACSPARPLTCGSSAIAPAVSSCAPMVRNSAAASRAARP